MIAATRIFTTLLVYFMGIGHMTMSSTSIPINSSKEHIDVYPESFSASFELTKGLIFVEANLEGKKANFILDTGAPNLVLNNRGKQGIPGTTTIKDVNGEANLSQVAVANFDWNGLNLKNRSFAALDLRHIESLTNRKIDGIIGFQTFKEYQLLIDYPSNKLQLSKSTPSIINEEVVLIVPFQMHGHFPAINVQIGNNNFLMGIDTGAEINIINEVASKKLVSSDFQKVSVDQLQGANGEIKKIETVRMNSSIIQRNTFPNMPYIFTDISHLNANKNSQIDGLLGFPFLKSHKCLFNFQEKQFYIFK